MFYDLPYKTKQFFFVLIKLSIVVGAGFFIYTKLVKNENLLFSNYISFLIENDPFSPKNIIFLIILTIFNWFFEIIKWQNLVKSIKKISLKEAFEQSLGGHTASLITPNRIGDYGAKAMYYSGGLKGKIILLNLWGNISQMTVTTVLGVIGFYLFLQSYDVEINYYRLTRFVFVFIVIGTLSIFGITHKKFRIKGYGLCDITSFLKKIPNTIHTTTFSISIIRYAIFSYQFYFLLLIFGVQLEYFDAMIVICSMYLLASIIPTISFFDVVVKGSVAVFLFSFLGVNELTILSITTTMWLLNFVIPSVFGSYFVLNFKLPNSEL